MLSATYIRFVQIAIITLVKHLLLLLGRLSITRTIDQPLQSGTRYIFASNHASLADPLTLWGVLSLRQLSAITPVKVMTARGVYYSALRPFIWSLGAFPAKSRRDKNDFSGVEAAKVYIASGYTIGIFPEGGRALPSAKMSYPGVTYIHESKLDSVFILVRLIWTPGPWWKRHLEVRAKIADETLDTTDAAKIMEAIYLV